MTLRPLASIAAACLLAMSGSHVLAQDAGAGKAQFAQCTTCHSTDGSNGVGPSLQGIVGRKAGTLAGFRYGRALKAAAVTWDATTLDGYIADPQQAVPATSCRSPASPTRSSGPT